MSDGGKIPHENALEIAENIARIAEVIHKLASDVEAMGIDLRHEEIPAILTSIKRAKSALIRFAVILETRPFR